MGSSSSKVATTASKVTGTAARKYPSRSPHSAPPSSSNRTNVQASRPSPVAKVGPKVYPEPHASESRSQTINLDASDPDIELNKRLQTLGPVQPNPRQSNSSTFNANPNSILAGDGANATTQFSSQFRASASNPSQTIYPTSRQGSSDPRQNPAVSLLTARYRLAEEADKEFAGLGRASSKGRQFLDVITIRQILSMREKGRSVEDIEKNFGLQSGAVGRLGRRGVVGVGSYD